MYQARIAECDREIEAQLERFEDRSDGEPPAPNGKKRNQKNAPRFDVQGQLYRMTGVDLTRIDGVDGYTALKVLSEIGTDMTKWPSAKHFASWLGLSPNNRITGGRVISSKTKPTGPRRRCVWRPTRCTAPTVLWGAFLRRKKAHLGAPKAITATAQANTWTLAPNITKVSISSGRCARPSVGRPNWATSAHVRW